MMVPVISRVLLLNNENKKKVSSHMNKLGQIVKAGMTPS